LEYLDPQHRRRRLTSDGPSTGFALTSGLYLSTAWLAALLWFPIVLTLRIIIAVRIGWDGTSSLYKASLILTFLLPPPIPEILFIVDRTQVHDVQPIDLAYVCCSLGLAYGPFLLLCLPLPFVAAGAALRARRERL
jgi:hypothetical protein